MGIRMSGLMSGLDTEAIVGALMSAQSLKKTKVERNKTKLEWKQTKWQDLNTKLLKLYNEQVSKLRLQSSYATKKATVSDSTKASVTAKSTAVNGSYTLEIENIATSQYLTGAKIGAKSTSDKLVSIDPTLQNKEITVTNGDKTKKFAITADTTIEDFTSALRSVGLNASYDVNQQKFFISSKESGVKNSFSITTSGLSGDEITERENLKNLLGYSGMSGANKSLVNGAFSSLQVATDEEKEIILDTLAKASYETKSGAANAAASTYMKAKLYDENYDEYKTKAQDSLKDTYFDESGALKAGKTQADYEAAVAKQADADTTSFVNNKISTDENIKTEIAGIANSGKTEDEITAELSEAARKKYYPDGNGGIQVKAFDGIQGITEDSIKADLQTWLTDYENVADRTADAGNGLAGLGLADITVGADGTVSVNGGANDSTNTSIPTGMALVAASDSKILLNGAELTSSTSTVSANGLEISLTGLTKGEEITFSVTNDVDSVYDSIKSFVKEYNEIMKEMNTLYNAESAKGYEPLSSEQKEAMTDEDVKIWEDKIKNSLLRNDSQLGGLIQGMRSAMMSTVTVDGKNYALSSFGIMTSTNYLEGGLLHIYGDKEDAEYADRDDKLKKALLEDPEAVTQALADIFENLRTVMSNKMAGTKTSSALTFYNDITMKKDLKEYEKDIKAWEDKLASMEDAYYKKFTAMEKAMAKLQSQQNSLAGLLGG